MNNEKKYKKKQSIKSVARNLAILLLTCVLSKIVIYNIASFSYFSQDKSSDFSISDFYDHAAYNSGTLNLDTNVVIISIDNSGREDIAQILDIVNDCEPCAIGMDVIFRQLSDADSLLCVALLNVSDRLVFPVIGDIERQEQRDDSLQSERFINIENLCGAAAGNVSLTTSSGREVVRDFYSNVPSQKPFSMALAEKKSEKAVATLKSRGNRTEKITYCGRVFYSYADTTILNYDFDPDMLYDKIVLLGTIEELSDMFVTPVNNVMPGVMIHAYSISTILEGQYMRTLPYWLTYAIALLLSYIVISLRFILVSHQIKYIGIITRIIPICVILLFVYWGYYIYITDHLYIDFSQSLVLLAFSTMAIDLWVGMPTLLKDIFIGIYKIILYCLTVIKKLSVNN